MTTAIGSLVKAYLRLTKKQTGLDPNHYIEVQTCNTFLDIEESMNALSYDKTDMQKSIDATVEASGYALKST